MTIDKEVDTGQLSCEPSSTNKPQEIEELEEGEPTGTWSSYWRYFFSSNSNSTDIQDTVIVPDHQEEDNGKPRNMVLPSFHSQFQNRLPQTENPSLFSKAINMLSSMFTSPSSNSGETLTDSTEWENYHDLSQLVDIMKKDPQNLGDKKIVIIGVHGWFPMKLVRSMIGEPTGTSVKFCEQMMTAVKNYFSTTFDITIPDESITTIPLQWEGKVLERVNKLYEYLISDWRDTIQQADIILWATHSQGTPVSALLLKRLIEHQVIQIRRQPISMLAMAGVSHGPFPSLKGNLIVKYFEADAARELFEFMDSNSDISQVFTDSMAYILQNRVKVVLVASMQDQVVPLYSAIMSGISHPNILRAIYVDGHIYSKNDFLIRLIVFALRLLNLGLSDHGFLIHISEVLAGNLYALEGGHSTIYEELQVFMLPLHYLFETSPIGSLEIQKILHQSSKENVQKAKVKVLDKVAARLDPFQVKLRMNPFHLPWAMRGIWDDPRILNDETLSSELETLQELFDKWNPTSAKLREIKFRLEPLKARL